MECRRVVRVPVSLGHTGAELREMNPGLSDLEIEGIMNASYELVAMYDLGSEKYVSIETVTRYRD